MTSTCGRYLQHPEHAPRSAWTCDHWWLGPASFHTRGFSHGYTCSEPWVTRTRAQPYTLYTIISETVGSHMSNIPNKLLLHSECVPYIPLVQKLSVCACRTSQMNCYSTLNIYPIEHFTSRHVEQKFNFQYANFSVVMPVKHWSLENPMREALFSTCAAETSVWRKLL